MVKMIAIVWCPYEESDLKVPWEIAENKWPDYIKINRGMSNKEIGTIVGLLAEISRYEDDNVEVETDVESIIEKIVSRECLILSGGIAVIDEETEKVVLPSCCCGLEGWREWEDFLATGRSPWMGHDPYPGIVTLSDKYIIGYEKYYTDEETKAKVVFEEVSIDITFEQFRENLKTVNNDLMDFLFLLKQWASFVCPKYTDRLVDAINKHFNVFHNN